MITEATAYANADDQTRLMRLGRVHGYLGVGVAFGFWSRQSADRMYDAILHRRGWEARLRRMARP
jgi:phage gp16-like protein